MGSPAKATAPKRAPGQVVNEPRHLGFGSVDARRCDVARVHALREIEHDDHVEVGGGNELGSAPVLRPRQRRRRRARWRSRPPRPSRRAFGAGRPVTSSRIALGIAEAAAGAREAEPPQTKRPRDDQREERADRARGVRELHGNLRMTQARKSASSATSATPGKSRNGKRSSNEAVEASNRVFSSRLRTSCMLAVSAWASVAT